MTLGCLCVRTTVRWSLGEVVNLAAFRSRKRESRLGCLKEMERICLRKKGLAACPDCRSFPACAVWQETFERVLGYGTDGLCCRPRKDDIVLVDGRERKVVRVRSALDVISGLDNDATWRFIQEQRARLGSDWLALFYRVEVEQVRGAKTAFEWHQVEQVLRWCEAWP